MRDETTRRAARTATLVALPIALVAGTVAFLIMKPRPAATGPVDMAAPALSAQAATACRALLAQLPETLRGLPRRPVTAGQEQNAAYGDPPVTIACGVPQPRVARTAVVWNLSRVCWYADGTAWTTVDREVPVTITVPAGYDGPGDRVNELSRTLVASMPSASTAPSGC